MNNVKQTVIKEAKKLMADGYSQRNVATMLGIARSTLQWWLRDEAGELSRNELKEQKAQQGPKILLYDVENAPSLGYFWRRRKENIGQSQVVSDSYLLTYSAKWLGNPMIMNGRITEPEDDKEICIELAQLFDQADIIVAHNNKKHDWPLLNTRLVANGQRPYSPVKLVDTLEIAKKNFKFPSNALDSLAAYLGLPRKMEHEGFELWKKCVAMDEDAFVTMMEYNDQDVLVLEEIYLKLRAWDQKAPNLNVYFNDDVKRCPCCASSNLQLVAKQSYTQQSAFDTYACQECGKMSRSKKNLRSKDAMQNTIVNVMQ